MGTKERSLWKGESCGETRAGRGRTRRTIEAMLASEGEGTKGIDEAGQRMLS